MIEDRDPGESPAFVTGLGEYSIAVRRAALAWCCLGWLVTAGCCHLPASGPARPRQPLPEALSAKFEYPRNFELPTRENSMKHRSRYDIEHIEMVALPDGFHTNRVVTLECYTPHGKAKIPAVLILPISGGGYDLEKHFAAFFAKRGWAAVIVQRRTPPREPANGEELNAVLGQSVIDARRAIDWIETRPELDAARLGVFGVSLGGIKAAMLTPLDARVRVAVLGLAGGDIPYVLRHTTEPGIARRREKILKEYRLKPDELEERYRAGLVCEPNTFAPYVPRDDVLLVLACCDRVVPIRKGRELREKMGRPETIFLPTGHYTALLCLPYVQHESLKFFRDRFYPRQPKGTDPFAGSHRDGSIH